ncbi:MAG: glycosyltransferase family 4 protein [Candidatus Brocadia sp.]|nr:glycosyltransferase family 4 protein [Candidatus Brocadia sp.]
MRILITSISFCEYIIQKANALVSKGNDVMLLMPQNLVDATVGDDISKLLDPKVSTLFYKGKRRHNRLCDLFSKKFLNKIASFSPDVIHIHCNGEMETLLISIRFSKIPLVVTIHDVIPHAGVDSRLPLRWKLICKYLNHRAAIIHVHGEKSKNELIQIHPSYAKKSFIIPHGTLSLFTRWDNGAVEKEPHTCLFFGRMEKYRGLDNLVEVGKILSNKLPEIKFIVAGRGSELSQHKESLRALGVFEIHDAFIPDKEIPIFFRRASLVLLPYHEASQSGIVHMGLAFGLPMVATAVGAIPEVIKDDIHGRIIPPGNIKEFAEAIYSLLQDRERLSRMSNACYERGRDLEFTNIIHQFETLYLKAINP